MRNVLILGATGKIGHWVAKLLKSAEVSQTLYVRTPDKLDSMFTDGAKVLQGDVLDTETLSQVMEGQDIVVAALSGDLLAQAKSIAKAIHGSRVSHVFWVTGLGIHHEVPGEVGKMLEYYVNKFPEYIEAADTIAACGIPNTLVRAANLSDGYNMTYYVQQEGEEIHAQSVDRCAVAKYMVDRIIEASDLNVNSSVGITN